jgi:hypothetical protein
MDSSCTKKLRVYTINDNEDNGDEDAPVSDYRDP